MPAMSSRLTETQYQPRKIQDSTDALMEALSKLDSKELVVTFKRVRIQPEATKIFGSVSLTDIATELSNVLGVTAERKLLVGERIKEIGSHKATLNLPNSTSLPVRVEVVDDDHGSTPRPSSRDA